MFGAVVYGTYGAVRGMAVWPIIGLGRWRRMDATEWLIGQANTARALAGGQLVVVALAVVAGVGL